MDKFANKIERILTPFGAKLQNVTFMQAISEALQATLPILIVGSFATLISSLDVGPWQGIVKSIPGLLPVCQKITLFTSGGFTLLMLIALAHLYCKKIEVKEYISCTALTVAVFLILSEITDGNIASSALGMRGMILALFVGILVPKSVKALIDKNVRIRMPSSVPKFVEEGYNPASCLHRMYCGKCYQLFVYFAGVFEFPDLFLLNDSDSPSGDWAVVWWLCIYQLLRSAGNVAGVTCFHYFGIYSASGINSKRCQSGSMEFRKGSAQCNRVFIYAKRQIRRRREPALTLSDCAVFL